MKRYHLIANTCLFLLVVLFSYTAITKLFTLGRFQFQLSRFPWLQAHPAAVAYTIIGFEIGVVVLLVLPRRIIMGFIASLTLLTAFTAYLIAMVLTAPNLPCTCGGVLEQLSWPQHIGFNLLCIGIATLGLSCEWRDRRERRLRKNATFSISHT